MGRLLLLTTVILGVGCLPPLPPEAERPPDPGVVVAPERHRGRAQIFALENYEPMLLFERAARKRSHQWAFDRQGIRFEEDKDQVVLVLSGRFFWKFDAPKVSRQEEAEEIWRGITAPFLEELFIKGRFKLGFDRVLLEARFERENAPAKSYTDEGVGRFNIKAPRPGAAPKPQKAVEFLKDTEAQIDGQAVILREKVLSQEH